MAPFPKLLDVLVREGSDCEDGCLLGWKLGFAAILLVEGLVFAHVPLLLNRFTSSSATIKRVNVYGHAVSAGIFLASGMLHVLPEAVALLAPEEEEHGEHGEHGDEEEEGEERFLIRQEEDEDDDHNEGEHDDEEDGHNHGGFPWAFFTVMVSFYAFLLIERVLVPRLQSKQKLVQDSEEEGLNSYSEGDERDMDDLDAVKVGFRTTAFGVGLLQVVGLLAHSLFESMALGLSNSFSTALSIFVATVTHRWATTIALGFKLSRHLTYLPFIVLMILFTVAVPAGVGIGLGLSSLSEKVRGVLFAISGGTFLYIGAYEGVAEAFQDKKENALFKFMGMFGGATVMTIITGILVATDMHG